MKNISPDWFYETILLKYPAVVFQYRSWFTNIPIDVIPNGNDMIKLRQWQIALMLNAQTKAEQPQQQNLSNESWSFFYKYIYIYLFWTRRVPVSCFLYRNPWEKIEKSGITFFLCVVKCFLFWLTFLSRNDVFVECSNKTCAGLVYFCNKQQKIQERRHEMEPIESENVALNRSDCLVSSSSAVM